MTRRMIAATVMSVSVEESFTICKRIAQQSGTNFYYSFLMLPRHKREAICAIYAFMRHSDDIADNAATPEQATGAILAWRKTVEDALNGHNRSEPILPALNATVRTFQIPPHLFQELLDGTQMDQTITRYETFEDLYRYCYRVASVVGLIVLPIFGYEDQRALAPAEACGIAFQLTNIIRDVKEDAAMGRIYLPLEELRRFGVSESDLMENRMTDAFRNLMQFQADRAKQYYRQAESLRGMIVRDSRTTLGVMIGVYRALLDKIERRQFAVFDEKIRLSTTEKIWIVCNQLCRH